MSREPKRKRETVFLADEIVDYLDTLKTPNSKGTKKISAKGELQKSMNLLVCWQQTVSPRLLEHTDNVVYSTRSKETEVLVYVDSPAYAAELNMDKEMYRLRMQQLTEKEIDDIKFLISRKTALKKNRS